MVELEKTYLIKEIPGNLRKCERKEIVDVYIPKSSEHPKLRLRKYGDRYELTKKEPVVDGDASRQEEQTVILDREEFDDISRQIDGKKTHKIRYCYNYKDKIAEIDVFQGDLLGLVLVDFEFVSLEDKNSFLMPDFCLADVTQETFLAGGMLCGKSYDDIKKDLEKFNYVKLFL